MRRSLIIALVALATYFLFDLKVLSSTQWEPRAFILERRLEIPLKQGWDVGYDGQWYYAIAADPFYAAKKLDIPAYRYQRIVYPLLIRIISLGRVEWMPWAMLIINLASAGIVAGILAELLSRRGVSAWFALVVISFLGFMLSMRMDLLEPLSLAFGLGGWITYDEKKPTIGILLFALSGLTKEIGLIFPAAMSAWLLWRGRWRGAVWLVILSVMPYFIWKSYLVHQFGIAYKDIEATRITSIPFSGLFTYKDVTGLLFVGIWAVVPSIVAGLGLVWDLWHRPTFFEHPEIFLIIFQVALIATLPLPTWVDPLAVLRTASGLIVSLLLWLALYHPRALVYVAACYAPSGLLILFVPGFL